MCHRGYSELNGRPLGVARSRIKFQSNDSTLLSQLNEQVENE